MHHFWTKTIKSIVPDEPQAVLQFILLCFFFFPLFVQLNGQIFHVDTVKFDAKGDILRTPLPIAIPFCLLAIVLCYRFEERHFGMGLVFSFFMAMMLSTIISAKGVQSAEFSRFLLLIQFELPIFAFVFGKLYLPPKTVYFRVEAVILYILLMIIPLQLITTFMGSKGYLSPDLILFSLYQHVQYLPLIFIGLFFISAIHLVDYPLFRGLLLFLSPWIGVYGIASISISTVGLLLTCSSLFFVWVRGQLIFKTTIVLLIWVSFLFYQPFVDRYYKVKLYETKASQDQLIKPSKKLAKSQTRQEVAPHQWQDNLPIFIKERVPIWSFYTQGIFSSLKTLLFGHENRPDRQSYPSAHNYYLDLLYNFGLVALIPIIYTLILTLQKGFLLAYRFRLTKEQMMLGLVISYFLFVDNVFKTGLRQPYPGMITFFLWGLFMERMDSLTPPLNNKVSDLE